MTNRYRREFCLPVLTGVCLSVSMFMSGLLEAGSVPAAAVNDPVAIHSPTVSSPGRHFYSRVGAVLESPDSPDAEAVTTGEEDAPVMVNINTASAEELAAALPGIGPGKAQNIVEWREANGPFQTVEQLLEVSGIGPKTLEAIRPHVLLADSVSTTRHLRHQSRQEDAVTLALGRVIRKAERDRVQALRPMNQLR